MKKFAVILKIDLDRNHWDTPEDFRDVSIDNVEAETAEEATDQVINKLKQEFLRDIGSGYMSLQDFENLPPNLKEDEWREMCPYTHIATIEVVEFVKPVHEWVKWHSESV